MSLACSVALLLGGFGAAVASAERGLTTGFASDNFNSADEAARVTEFGEARAAGGEFVRFHVQWRAIAPTQPADPRNPADPTYDFATLDASLRDAQAQGLKVLMMIRQAPDWVEGSNRPPVSGSAPAGTWKPRPGPANAFGHAIARRYSGAFPDPTDPERMLPRVRNFQIWNEPNLPDELNPQWQDKRPASPFVYRRLLNAFYRGIKSVDRSNVVVTGGTAPYGDDTGPRLRPLEFWRVVMCLRPNLKRSACPKPKQRAHFDVLACHPINTSGGPFQGALHPDDLSSPDMWRLREVLRAAERLGTIKPAGSRPLWATEIWYHPDVVKGNFRKQARWLTEALYLLWRDGVSVAINFLVRDTGATVIKSGAYTEDGTKKPAFTALRFPFVAFERGRQVELWGKAPRRGQVLIHRDGPGKWRRVARVRAGSTRIFHARVRMRGRPSLRASVGGEQSLPYKVRPGPPLDPGAPQG